MCSYGKKIKRFSGRTCSSQNSRNVANWRRTIRPSAAITHIISCCLYIRHKQKMTKAIFSALAPQNGSCRTSQKKYIPPPRKITRIYRQKATPFRSSASTLPQGKRSSHRHFSIVPLLLIFVLPFYSPSFFFLFLGCVLISILRPFFTTSKEMSPMPSL